MSGARGIVGNKTVPALEALSLEVLTSRQSDTVYVLLPEKHGMGGVTRTGRSPRGED